MLAHPSVLAAMARGDVMLVVFLIKFSYQNLRDQTAFSTRRFPECDESAQIRDGAAKMRDQTRTGCVTCRERSGIFNENE